MVKYLQPMQIGTTSERSSSPVPKLEGIHFYDTTLHRTYIWSGGAWLDGPPIEVRKDDVVIRTGVTVLNFEGGADVVYDGSGKVTITTSGGGESPTASMRQAVFTITGALVSGTTSAFGIPNHLGASLGIVGVYLDIKDSDDKPTGDAIVVDINISDPGGIGTTIFTNQSNRPQIAANNNAGNTTVIDSPEWADGKLIYPDVDQIGSTFPGANLVITIVCS
jgi:hypothetical protein